MLYATSMTSLLVVGAALLFWVGILGLLWRRSLVGMLLGLLFCWLSVGLLAVAFAGVFPDESTRALGSTLALCTSILGSLHVVVGLGIVVARIKRRGSLDADDAGLLEG